MINFPKRIAENICGFTGRAWLLPKLLDWWEQDDVRLFLLTGDPGTGKSMILGWLAGFGPVPADPTDHAQLVRLREVVKAAHFCQTSSRNITPQAFAESIANQLTSSVAGFADALATTLAERVLITATQTVGTIANGGTATNVAIGRIDFAALGDELSFDRAFTQPLMKLYGSGYTKPMLLLVDALDEAFGYSGDKTLPELLSTLGNLPPQVRILMTTRNDPRVLAYFDEKPFDLIKNAPPNVDDVQNYVFHRLSDSAGLTKTQVIEFSRRVATQAKGVFLYAAIVLDELLPRLPQIPDLETYPLPDGLSGLYHAFLKRELGTENKGRRWHQIYKPLLGLIAVSQGEGLTTEQLSALIGQEVAEPLDACKQYLSGELPDGPFSPFHKSFADFLLEDKKNVHYRINAQAMHERIAKRYWTKHRKDWSSCDEYGLNNLPTHLAFSGDHISLSQLLLDPAWLQAKLDAAGLVPLLADYDLIPNNPDISLVQKTIRLSSDVLAKDRTQLLPQLYGRLMSQREQPIQAMLKHHPSGPWLRPLTATLMPAGGACLQKTSPNHISVFQLALMPDGRQLMLACDDGRVVFWDLQKWEKLRVLSIDTRSMALTQDGSRLVYATTSQLVVCEVQTGHTLITLDAAPPFAITADGQCIVASSLLGRITSDNQLEYFLSVWDLVNGCKLFSLPGQDREITALAIMPDERCIVSGSCNGELKVWDLKNRTALAKLKLYDAPINTVVTNGRHVAVADSILGRVSVWDLGSAEELLAGFAPKLVWDHALNSSIRAITLIPDGKSLALGLGNGKVLILDCQNGAEICRLPGHEYAVTAVVGMLDNRRLVSSSEDGTLIIWDLDRAVVPLKLAPGHTAPVNAVTISSNGRIAVTAAGELDRQDNTLKVWDLGTGAELHTLYGHSSPVRVVMFLPEDGRRAVSCSTDTGRGDADTRLWNVETGDLVGGPFYWRGKPKALAMTTDGRRLIGAFSNFASVLNLDDGSDRLLCCRHTTDVSAVVVTRDGRYVLTADSDGMVAAWSLETEECVSYFRCHPRSNHVTLGIVANDRLIIASDNDYGPSLWDWQNASLVKSFQEHELPVNALAVTPDGRRFLSGSKDSTIFHWDVETYNLLNKFECGGAVRDLAIAADGQHAISVSDDEVLTVWDLSAGCRLASYYTDRPVRACAITPDGRTVVAGDEDGRVAILRLESG
ncbi:MAG: hypothetical protein PHO08_05935 [Methylococcales bacterium]|nr:hypothetical protein [Methylococcales bacterium]